MTFAVIDVIFIVIITFCAIHGVLKGFIDELFSKLAVIAAVFCGLVFYKNLVPNLPQFGGVTFLTNILAFLILFVIVYILVRLLQKIIGFAFQGDIMKGLDRSLGFFLGIAEGFLLVAVVLFLLHSQTFFDVTSVLTGSIFDEILAPLFVAVPTIKVSTGVSNV